MTSFLRLKRLSELAEHIADGSTILVITTPGRRHLDTLRAHLAAFELTVFDQAVVHVPRASVEAALTQVKSLKPSVIITLGGGAATGLGKMLRLKPEGASLRRFVAIATTYAGSEMTRIWGSTHEGKKKTGRDDRARPDIVVHDAELLLGLPRQVALTSMFNAMAHPISTLSAGIEDGPARQAALTAVRRSCFAARQLISHATRPDVREAAFEAAAAAAKVLDENTMGLHHRVAHLLGGAHALAHAPVHALLLPHCLGALHRQDPALFAEICEAARCPDLPAFVHDTLLRVGAPVDLRGMGVSEEAIETAAGSLPEAKECLRDAWLGARVSTTQVRKQWQLASGDELIVTVDGSPREASKVVFALHGRGSTSTRICAQLREAIGHLPEIAIVAPQAPTGAWYELGYDAPAQHLDGPLSGALKICEEALDRLRELAPQAKLYVFGFSQGACLALELATRTEHSLSGLLCPAGARPSGGSRWPSHLDKLPVLLSIADEDPWVRLADVQSTAAGLREVGAEVTLLRRSGKAHQIGDRDRLAMRRMLLNEPSSARGYGGHHEACVLEGAVPAEQNSPRKAPYGLYPEQLNGTSLVAPRHANQRTWVYRVRPSAQHSPFEKLGHQTFGSNFDEAALINLAAWRMPTLAFEGHDFIDGLVTLGGAGHPSLRRGYAIHLYAANRDMVDRAFTNADGDLLVIPSEGELTILTELGSLDLGPGRIAIIPRGLRFSVLLHEGRAKGYVAEIFARHFALPDRGLIGANALADERHFEAPLAFYEDRLALGFRMSAKMGGKIYEARQDHSPYDVVGWHGSYLPYVYDLRKFAAVSNTRIDHADPSIYTVLSAGLDEHGAHGLDFLVFPARWDPTEHTFRPPFFHRNVTTEINGIISDSTLREPFEPGILFITPSMTAHGVRASVVDAKLSCDDAQADRPTRTQTNALWFQFETTLPFCPSPWAREAKHQRADWPLIWGEYGSYFDPKASGS